MIRKIKTNVNGILTNNTDDNNSSNNSAYDTSSRNAGVEDFDLSTFTNEATLNQNTSPIAEETVLTAIEKNFAENRNLSNEMNNQIYSALKEKIANYIANGGGNI